MRCGLKSRIVTLLTERQDDSLTIGEISRALDLAKTDNPDIASVLVKLRNTGRVKSSLGPASSPRGRRYVKRYQHVPPKPPSIVVVTEADTRRQLSFKR